MDSARDAVLQLEVHLGNGVFREYGGVRDISCGEKDTSASYFQVISEVSGGLGIWGYKLIAALSTCFGPSQ